MPTILTRSRRDPKAYECDCSICGEFKDSRLFTRWIYDGGEKICKACQEDFDRQRTRERSWFPLPYYLKNDDKEGNRLERKQRIKKYDKERYERKKRLGIRDTRVKGRGFGDIPKW